MMKPSAHRQPKPKILVSPKSSPAKAAMMPGTVPLQDMIRERAYELCESRGRQPDLNEQDWLGAEEEILKQQR